MAARPDGVEHAAKYDTKKRWSFSGGDEDDESITLFIGTGGATPDKGGQYHLVIGLKVDDEGELYISGVTTERLR